MIKEALNVIRQNPLYALIVLGSIALILMIAILIIEYIIRKPRKEEYHETNKYLAEMRKLAKSGETGQKKLDLISSLAKEFFHETFSISKAMSFSEISSALKDKPEIVQFCSFLSQVYYSKDGITEQKLKKISGMLYFIITKHSNLVKEKIRESKPIHKEYEEISNARLEARKIINRLRKSAFHGKTLPSSEFRREYNEYHKIYKSFNSAFRSIYASASKEDKLALHNLIEEWKKENKKLRKSHHNPEKNLILELELFERFLVKFAILAAKKL